MLSMVEHQVESVVGEMKVAGRANWHQESGRKEDHGCGCQHNSIVRRCSATLGVVCSGALTW